MAKRKSGSSTAPMPVQADGDWRAEDDFRTLRNAQEIRSDRGRFSQARRSGRKQLRLTKQALLAR